MTKGVKKIAESLGRRIRLAIGRAVLEAVSDAGKRQTVQFSAFKGQVKDAVQRMQEYGFTSHPLTGAEVLYVCVGGNSDHPVAISVDDPRYRLTGLQPGECALYTHDGTKIILKLNGKVHITAATEVLVDTPILKCTGDIIDNFDAGGQSMQGMRAVYNIHTHHENDVNSETDAPTQTMEGV